MLTAVKIDAIEQERYSPRELACLCQWIAHSRFFLVHKRPREIVNSYPPSKRGYPDCLTANGGIESWISVLWRVPRPKRRCFFKTIPLFLYEPDNWCVPPLHASTGSSFSTVVTSGKHHHLPSASFLLPLPFPLIQARLDSIHTPVPCSLPLQTHRKLDLIP